MFIQSKALSPVAVVLLLLYSCHSNPVENPGMTDKKNTVSNITYTQVETIVTKEESFQYLIQATGKIRSELEVLISAEAGGTLKESLAANGKQFVNGSVIAQIDPTSIIYRLERAELNRFNNENEYRSQLLGYEALLKDKSYTEAETIKKKLQISTGLLPSEQDIKEARYELEKTAIRAPFSGILADVKISKGQQIKPGQELFKIYDPENFLLDIKVLETDVFSLSKGLTAEIMPIAGPVKKYNAEVDGINPYIDESGMALIRLKIRGHSALFPGMNCQATIRIPSRHAVIVPREAIVMRDDRAVVFTIADGKAQWNYVSTGRTNGKTTEILEGIKAGQKVIIRNNLQLAHGAPVIEVPVPAISSGK
jgi:RND family efflux transporter MFP subunit